MTPTNITNPFNSPETIGVEFESVIATRDKIIQELYIPGGGVKSAILTCTRDASVESFMTPVGRKSSLFLGNPSIKSSLRASGKETVTAGYEIVTNPLPRERMRQVIRATLATQRKMGEIFSERSSTHVHLGFPRGLIFLKGALATGLVFEPLLFKIAGMGTKFRGLSNNSAYSRPLSIPPAVLLSDSPRFTRLQPEAALSAKSEETFWHSFGVTSAERGRYIPARYMAVNLYSTLLRGTLEWRFFNFCSTPILVESIVSLCQLLTDVSIRVPMDVIQDVNRLSLTQENSDAEYESLLDELMKIGRDYRSEYDISTEDIKGLLYLIRNTPQPMFEDRVPVLSHVPNHRLTRDQAEFYKLPIIGEATPAQIVDIHTFANTIRTLAPGGTY